jgi:Ig-like domain-containing protein
MIATGTAGGTDSNGFPLPALPLFSSLTISSGFYVTDLGWHLPYVTLSPRDQIAAVGANVVFHVSASPICGSLSYQWQFNEVDIPGAIYDTLSLTDIQPQQAGSYRVRVSNDFGSVYAGPAILTVTGQPVILAYSVPQSAEAGATVRLGVHASGIEPLGYQWRCNGLAVPGGTNRLLEIPGIQPSQAGVYTVIVTNFIGSATSPAAMVGVISPVPRTMVPGLILRGEPGAMLIIEYSPVVADPVVWTIRENVALTNSSQWYFDLSAPASQGLYRTSQSSGGGPGPTLDLHMVPAITLTGSIGNSVRLDYINQFGPTDAWVTLATITLTNSSQLYFDTSMIGQVPRLYRIVPIP